MDEELRRYLDLMRQETAESLAETREHSERIAAETREQTWLHFDIVAERLEAKIATIAEAVIHVDQKLDREAADIRSEMRRGFADTQAMIKFSHSELDRRIMTLEEGFVDLKARIERLESSAH
ncbi:MAG: hypothetical protein WA208_06090 [Thermoanaerobaculia bacterium]